jgi:hypothetical protein
MVIPNHSISINSRVYTTGEALLLTRLICFCTSALDLAYFFAAICRLRGENVGQVAALVASTLP